MLFDIRQWSGSANHEDNAYVYLGNETEQSKPRWKIPPRLETYIDEWEE